MACDEILRHSMEFDVGRCLDESRRRKSWRCKFPKFGTKFTGVTIGKREEKRRFWGR